MTRVRGVIVFFVVLAITLVFGVGCTQPPEEIARNVIATASGATSTAQGKYLKECTENPAAYICQLINRSVDAQNASITALRTYCSSAVDQPIIPGTKCVPVKSALPALQVTVSNLSQLIKELKAAAQISQNRDRKPLLPADTPINQANLSASAIALAILGLRTLLDSLLKGRSADIADDILDSVTGALAELESVQGTDVTMDQLENMRLHKLWPDLPGDNAPSKPPTPTPPAA